MRLVGISDTHGHHRELSVPEGDVLIFSGDCCYNGTLPEAMSFVEWWNTLDHHKHKILVPGNHDFPFAEHLGYLKDFVDHRTDILIDESVVIDGVTFYGSPYTPKYGPFAFMLKRGEELRRKWELVPWDTNILITHGPPYDILDEAEDGTKCGCKNLLQVSEWTSLLQAHFFGHIHEAYGTKKIGNIEYINASMCNRNLDLVNDPIVIDI